MGAASAAEPEQEERCPSSQPAAPSATKVVVLAIGTTGAVEYFRPLQPALGAVSVLLLGIALRARWKTRPLPPIAQRQTLLSIGRDARAVEQS